MSGLKAAPCRPIKLDLVTDLSVSLFCVANVFLDELADIEKGVSVGQVCQVLVIQACHDGTDVDYGIGTQL